MEYYPLKFEPFLKKILWGGEAISRLKQSKHAEQGIGESWEIAQISGHVSVVAEGPSRGRTLDQLIEENPEGLLGKRVYERFGHHFPLLIKFIDAEADLSIQVHPDDALARERHGCSGKTEMWYVIDAKPGARLFSGFSTRADRNLYQKHLAEKTLVDLLQPHEVHPGDVFYLPAGRVHSIGAGILLAEIQQSSDITYRLYDFDRKDAAGNLRELHTELALDAIDFETPDSLRTEYEPLENACVELVQSPYFTTNRIHLKPEDAHLTEISISGKSQRVLLDETIEMDREYQDLDSFVILICLQGEVQILYGSDQSVALSRGETILLPASLGNITLNTSQESLLLETYIPE